MARRSNQELAFNALSIEGALLAPDFLTKVAHLEAAEQSEADYDIPRGLKLRDEIGRYWKIAQNLWNDFSAKRERTYLDAHQVTARDFLEPFCRHVLGFADLRSVGQVTLDERIFPIGFAAGGGRIPLVFAAHDQGLDKPSSHHGDGVRRRSPFLLAQEYLNASGDCLWAVVSNGLKLRILRDNASLTRPAYIEADLEAIFTEGLYPDFTALWLVAHASRFGKVGTEPTDCALERWRNTAQEDGIRARDRLRVGVTEALRALGTGFLAHKDNTELRRRIEAGELSTQAYFEQLLRLIYRFIFLATIEDRELVFAPDTTPEARERYLAGYSLTRLRQLASRRRSYDRHADLWQVLTITFGGLGKGQPALALPALGGLFDAAQCPDLDTARLENQALLSALFSLCFFRDGAALSRVNYRDMDSEELGSVYESLLELVPQLTLTGGARTFGFIGDEAEGSTKGNARKLTGSYYTPDSLVQELIKSALVPIIERTLEENPQEPVKALLALTVCDPACGSGHFLLAAARRIADEVALLCAPEGNPTEDDFRHALRDVVAHCIYGVDKNPMAVELARTALWLEAYTPDRPLTFLDAHLRCGDALLGVLDESILQDGIPDKAFNALSGDDKEVVKRIKKANRDALKAIAKAKEKSHQMLSLDLGGGVDADAFEALPDDTLEALEAKRAAHATMEASIATSRARLAADIFVAAFVLPKTVNTETCVPTSQDLWLVLDGGAPRPGIEASAHEAANAAQAFHWWQGFPQVRAKGGFDVLLGNPPWERIKLQEEEFFATRSPLVAEAQHKAERGKRIGLLAEGMLLHSLYPEVEAAKGIVPPNRAEIALFEEFTEAKRNIEATSLFAHDSGRYPLTGVGDVNTYALFAESFAQLVCLTGRAGVIVPSGIGTDDSTKRYFQFLVDESMLVSFFGFDNARKIFPAVHPDTPFSLVTIGKTARDASLAHYLLAVENLADRSRHFHLTSDEFRLINPNTLTCPIFRSERDAELAKKLYRATTVLIREGHRDENAWAIRFHTRFFHMAEDSHHFVTEPEDGDIPVYEAKMMHTFDHRWATYEQPGSASRDCTESEKVDAHFLPRPRYWVKLSEFKKRVSSAGIHGKYFISWRLITNATNERTYIATVLPRVAVSHSLTAAFFDSQKTAIQIACFLANAASLVLDFCVRQKIGGTNMTLGIVKQLPIFPPERYSEADFDFVAPRVLELTYTAHDLTPWAEDLGYDGPPFPWNPERRAQLRAELDAYYARLYGLTRDELRYILDPADVMGEDYPSETFRVLKNNEMREFGEYRTQRLVLEAWDRLADMPNSSQRASVFYSEQGMIRNAEEGRLAGLVMALVEERADGISMIEVQSAVAALPTALHYLGPDGARFGALQGALGLADVAPLLNRVLPIVQRLVSADVLVRSTRGGEPVFSRGAGTPPSDVVSLPEHREAARLLWQAERLRAEVDAERTGVTAFNPKATGSK